MAIMAARYPEWRKESPAKMALKLIVVLGAFLLLIYCLLKVLVVNKEPLTADAVSNIVSSHGYTPQETIDIYHYKKPESKRVLDHCIAFESDDIHFEYWF